MSDMGMADDALPFSGIFIVCQLAKNAVTCYNNYGNLYIKWMGQYNDNSNLHTNT